MKKAPVRLLNTNNSLSLPHAQSNNENEEKTLEELDKEIKATTKEEIEERKQNNTYKEKNNLYEIRKFETQFLSGASKDENGNLVWNATVPVDGHEFTFRVNYELSGYKELQAGEVKITIPKRILRNRNGNLDDYYIMSLPTLKECKEEDKMTDLIYKEDGDYLVIYNPEELDAGLNGYFEISYATNSESYNYKDYNPENTNLVKNGGTASDEFYATLELNVDKSSENSEKELLNNITEDKNVFINTNVIFQGTQKRYPKIHREWNSAWMETELSDKDEYYYLVWEIESYIESVTQLYNFTLEDFVTNLTDGMNEDDYEFVGYKLSGEQYYSNKNTAENQKLIGYRYDYVLTRHRKEAVDGIAYKLKNTVNAKVHPLDGVDADIEATSSNIFNWDPGYTPPGGSFDVHKYGNNNWYDKFKLHWDYANYDLDKLQSGEVNELKKLKFFTETIGYAYPWTLKEDGSIYNPDDYGKNNVNYETWDDTLYLEDDETPMNADDYYLDYFTYNVQNKDAEFDDFYNQFNEVEPQYEDNEILTFYAKFGDRKNTEGNEWISIGTYNLKTKELTPNVDYISEMTTGKITFKEGVHATAWKFTTSNKHYYTYITVTPYYVLTNSDYVMEKIAGKDSIKFQNKVTTNITDCNGNTIFRIERSAFDYARVTYYDSDITKTVVAFKNNNARRQYAISWRINAWEKVTSNEGVAEYLKQDKGTFFDILPIGGEIDVNSIRGSNRKRFLA